jgi:hypothetical protein
VIPLIKGFFMIAGTVISSISLNRKIEALETARQILGTDKLSLKESSLTLLVGLSRKFYKIGG